MGSSGTNTTTSNTSPPPEVLAAYQALMGRATNVADTPYTQYTGATTPIAGGSGLNFGDIANGLVAPLTQQQQQLIGQTINTGTNTLNPWLGTAASYASRGADPITGQLSQTASANMNPFASSAADYGASSGLDIGSYGTGAGSAIGSYGTGAGSDISNYALNGVSRAPQFQAFSPEAISQYMSPYTENVVNATQRQFAHDDAVQQNSALGTAIRSGNAFGGDRAGVAAAELAGQQARAHDPVIAGLYDRGYSQALGQFNTGNQEAQQAYQTGLGGLTAAGGLGLQGLQSGAGLGLQGLQSGAGLGLQGLGLGAQGYGQAQQLALTGLSNDAGRQLSASGMFGNLGNEALTGGLAGLNAAYGAASIPQQQDQRLRDTAYQQFMQQQAYPFATTSFLGNQVLGVGSNSGGTSSTTGPRPALSFLKHGGRVPRLADGGGLSFGEVPWISVNGQAAHMGKGPPAPPGQPQQSHMGVGDTIAAARGANDLYKWGKGQFGGDSIVPNMDASGTLLPDMGASSFDTAGFAGLGGDLGGAAGLGGASEAAGLGAAGAEAGLGAGLGAELGAAGAGIMEALPFLAMLNRGGAVRPRRYGDGGMIGYADSVTAPSFKMQMPPQKQISPLGLPPQLGQAQQLGQPQLGMIGLPPQEQMPQLGAPQQQPVTQVGQPQQQLGQPQFGKPMLGMDYNTALALKSGFGGAGFGTGLPDPGAGGTLGMPSTSFLKYGGRAPMPRAYADGGLAMPPMMNAAPAMQYAPAPPPAPPADPEMASLMGQVETATHAFRQMRHRAAGGLVMPSTMPLGFARGGMPHFDNGGGLTLDDFVSPDQYNRIDAAADSPPMNFADRAAPVQAAIADGTFDPQGAGYTTFAPPPQQMAMPLPKPAGLGMPELPEIVRPPQPSGLPSSAMAYDNEQPPGGLSMPPDMPQRSPPPRYNEREQNGLDRFMDSPMLALVAGVLGAAASGSPFRSVAIGQGALTGLSTYGAARKMSQDADKIRADLERQDAAQRETARHNAAGEAVQQTHYGETIRHNKAAEGLAERQRAMAELPFGWKKNEDGSIEPIKGGPHDPGTLRAEAEAKRLPGMSDDALGSMVQSYRAGNTGVLAGVGRGVQGSDNLNRFWNIMSQQMKEEGATGKDLASAKANFTAQSAAARSSAVREANVASAVEEARNTFPLALQRSEEVPRTQFVPWNRAVQMVQSGTSSPELARFVTANQAVITAYSQAMSRTGVNTVHAQQHAENLLSTATSPEAYRAVIGQMTQEMDAALAAPEAVKKRILEGISGRGGEKGAPLAGTSTAAPAGAPSAAPARVRQNGHTYERQPDGSYKAVD